jgi:hypothetical protein
MSAVRIGEGQISFAPDSWDAAIEQIPVLAASQLVRGMRKRDPAHKRAETIRRNVFGLATSVYDQLDATERSALLAYLRLKQGREKFDQLLKDVYSMVGKMVTSGKGGEVGEKLFDAMWETSSDPASQERAELIWRLCSAVFDRLTALAQTTRYSGKT